MLLNKLINAIFIDGISLVKKSSLRDLNSAFRWRGLKKIILNVDESEYKNFISLIDYSESQFLQDLFVVSVLGCKKNGYFVEFGATDGKNFSNTYMLEKKLGWVGILSEPSKQYHQKLNAARDAKIDFRCIANESKHTIKFSELIGTGLSKTGKLGLLEKFKNLLELHKTNSYEVETISLVDLLNYYEAPKILDFLSIDVEGSEYKILEAFRWDLYTFNVITVEHNFTKQRKDIYKLLTANGYKRVHEDISYVDDWYVHENLNYQ